MESLVAYSRSIVKPRVRREVLMSGRMKALLAALAAIGFAAMNASFPWGP
jgi:hypothetical protein